MAKVVHALRLEPGERATLKAMARAANIPFATYMRVVCLQHIKTPLKLNLNAKPAVKTKLRRRA